MFRDLPASAAVVSTDVIKAAADAITGQHHHGYGARYRGDVFVRQAARHHDQAVHLAGHGEGELATRRGQRRGDQHRVAGRSRCPFRAADDLVLVQRRLFRGLTRLTKAGEQQADDASPA